MGLFLKTHNKRTEDEIIAAFGAEPDDSDSEAEDAKKPPQPTDSDASSAMSGLAGMPKQKQGLGGILGMLTGKKVRRTALMTPSEKQSHL